MVSRVLVSAICLSLFSAGAALAREPAQNQNDSSDNTQTAMQMMMKQMQQMDEQSEKMFQEFFKDDQFSNPTSVFDNFDRAQQQMLDQVQKNAPQMIPNLQNQGQPNGTSSGAVDFSSAVAGNPQITQEETADHVMVHVKIPGMDQNSVNIKVDDSTIHLEGSVERQQEQEDKSSGYYAQTHALNRFQQVFPIPEGVDPKGMTVKKSNDEVVLDFPKLTSASHP
jgi:HSP20 family molecular chaperone IbpA